jgi:purine-binding chemotaxis protein CheW
MNEMDFNLAAEDTLHGKYLTFFLDQECYGMEISFITDIIQMQPIATLPEVKHYVKGIINLRGEIIPVMDVRLRFGKPEIAYTERTCVIVARTSALCVGLIVDSVSEVIKIPDEGISQPPKINGNSNRFIKSIGKVGQEIKLLLDFEKLVADDDFESVARLEATTPEAAKEA